MPTWIENGCEHFLWATATSSSTALGALLSGAGWTESVSSNFISGNGPYTGNRAAGFNANNRNMYRELGANYSEFYFNFHYNPVTVPGSTSQIVGFNDGTSNQVDLRITPSAQLQLTRNGTVLDTSSAIFSANTWHFIQVKLVVNNTTGVLIVRINNAEILNFSGDTQTSANAYINRIYLINSNVASANNFWANLVAYSDSASWPLAERSYKLHLCDAAGNSTQFTPLSSTNVSQIDEQQPDADTTYNSSTTPGNIDLFGTAAALSSGESIDFSLEESWIKKTDAGARDARQVIRVNSTNYESSSHSLTSGYVRYRNFRTTNPNTAAAWTPTEINGAEVGYKDQA